MASGTNFKIYDPVAQLIASGSGSGGGLPLTGGTLTGNLILQVPAKVVQSQPPVNPSDLANKQYVDSLIGGGPFLPLIGGTLTGNVVLTSPSKIQQNQAPTVGDDLANKTYVDSKVNTPNSIPGTSIQNGTVTNAQLALGAAASNINAGPPGSINASQIAGGPFLPLTGGTMSGQITQSLTPMAGTDLVNKTYVDGNFQSKKPAHFHRTSPLSDRGRALRKSGPIFPPAHRTNRPAPSAFQHSQVFRCRTAPCPGVSDRPGPHADGEAEAPVARKPARWLNERPASADARQRPRDVRKRPGDGAGAARGQGECGGRVRAGGKHAGWQRPAPRAARRATPAGPGSGNPSSPSRRPDR